MCLDGLRLAREMFRSTISSELGSLSEPIKHLRSGAQIQAIAPKVPAYDAVSASGAIDCTDLIELSSYSRDPGGMQCVYLPFLLRSAEEPHPVIRRRQTRWDSVRSGSLVEIEIYIRAAPVINRGGHRVYYELCSICVVDDSVFQK